MTKQVRALAKEILETSLPSFVFDSVVQEPYVFARITLKDTVYVGVGFAKCNPVDKFHWARGLEIAVGRAAKALAGMFIEAQLDISTADLFSQSQKGA